MLDLLSLSVPKLAIAAGLLLLLWGQSDRLGALAAKLRPAPKAKLELGPRELFERFYELRTWCEAAGQAEAVQSLDGCVLPAIVRQIPTVEGGIAL